MYLLDTDHCIFLMRRSKPVCEEFERRGGSDAYISIITVGELLFGAYRSARQKKNLEATHRLLDALPALPLSMASMDRFAKIKVDLFRTGRKIEDPDILIAATALEHDLTLVTHNRDHYARVPGLRVEDWEG